MPDHAAVQLVAVRLVHDTELRAAVDGQADHHRELAVARDELLGAVERIDEPAAPGSHRVTVVEVLLRDDAVTREALAQLRDDEGVGAPVGLGHRVGLALELYVEARRVHLEHQHTCLARELSGDIDLGLQHRGAP
jgi:hypothetical protein